MSPASESPTRREFVIASAGLASAAAFPAASYARVPGANDRIRIGMIGVSPYMLTEVYLFLWLRRKTHNCDVTSVCDVFRPNLDLAVEKTGGRAVQDYREILDDSEIDAVVIGAPDHWHAAMALDAASAGKDIYLETPMTRTWEQAIQVRDAVHRGQLVFQCGAQLTSDDRFHQARQIVDGGAIGQILMARSIFARNSRIGFFNRPISADVTRANLDWKAWLGPAPARDFDARRFGRWQKYWDYSGGTTTNLLFQNIAVLLVATATRMPCRVVAAGGSYLETAGEVPDTYFSIVDYGDYSFQLTASLGNEQGHPTSIRGHQGTLVFDDSIDVVRERYFVKEYQEREKLGLFNVTRTTRPDHVTNWLECLRSREKPVCHEDLAQAAMIAAHLGELAFRENRTMLFDGHQRKLLDSLASESSERAPQ